MITPDPVVLVVLYGIPASVGAFALYMELFFERRRHR